MTRPKNAIVGATWAIIGYVLLAVVVVALIGLYGWLAWSGVVR